MVAAKPPQEAVTQVLEFLRGLGHEGSNIPAMLDQLPINRGLLRRILPMLEYRGQLVRVTNQGHPGVGRAPDIWRIADQSDYQLTD